MLVSEIYKKFDIPNNLVHHMMTVALVVKFIQTNWTGKQLDWDQLIKAALLHDLGNIVKFDMDKYPELMKEEVSRIDYWKKIQKKIIKKYGTNDHLATEKMLNKVNIEQSITKLILDKSFGNVIKVVNGNDWYAKILLFADLKVGPTKIMLVKERITDIKNRMPHYTNRKDFPAMLLSLEKLDEQIQEYLAVDINSVENNLSKKLSKDLLGINI